MTFGLFVMGFIFGVFGFSLFMGSDPYPEKTRSKSKEGALSIAILLFFISAVSFIWWGFAFGIEAWG